MNACGDKKGTRAGAVRHKTAKEDVCLECAQGEKEYYSDWESNNRDKRKVIRKRTRSKSPEKIWAEKLWYYYKITPDQYHSLLNSQGGHCAICPAVKSSNGYRLSVDHDHSCCSSNRSCGKCVRGLLCNRCNRLLGIVQDDKEFLSSMITYLGKL